MVKKYTFYLYEKEGYDESRETYTWKNHITILIKLNNKIFVTSVENSHNL